LNLAEPRRSRQTISRHTIPVPGQPWIVQITDDHSRTLIDPSTQVAFHSASGAASETRHVYLHNSSVASRLAAGQATSVLEIGLGTGMGLLMSVDAAIAAGVNLRYVAVESAWLPSDVLEQLNLSDWVQEKSVVKEFLNWRRSLGDRVSPGLYCRQVGSDQHVTVHVTDAVEYVNSASSDCEFDAIYFDPFAPAVNPELWQPDFLTVLGRLLSPRGRLVTYCVSRAVREAFTEAGFQVERVRGPVGGKREVLIATRKE
jgi:tRNA U34 5-methylaminomethyl-2-thiouridine-forming methyltransferase MnmC